MEKQIDYISQNLIKYYRVNSYRNFDNLPKEIQKCILEIFNKYTTLELGQPGMCIQISENLYQKINKVAPGKVRIVGCANFNNYIRTNYNDIKLYFHRFILYNNEYFIDLTIRQFNIFYPFLCVRKVSEGHLGFLTEHLKYLGKSLDINYNQGLHNIKF